MLTFEEGIFLGAMLGDGYLCKPNYLVGICGHRQEDRRFLFEIIQPMFERLCKRPVKIKEDLRKNTLHLYVYSKEKFYKLHEERGLVIGKSEKGKVREEFLSHLTLMRKIVAGFFATDGSLVLANNNGAIYPRIEFQNISKKLLMQIQHFLSNGIGLNGGGLYVMYRKDGVRYRLQYNEKENLFKFVREIGLINPKMKERLKLLIKAGVVQRSEDRAYMLSACRAHNVEL